MIISTIVLGMILIIICSRQAQYVVLKSMNVQGACRTWGYGRELDLAPPIFPLISHFRPEPFVQPYLMWESFDRKAQSETQANHHHCHIICPSRPHNLPPTFKITTRRFPKFSKMLKKNPKFSCLDGVDGWVSGYHLNCYDYQNTCGVKNENRV